MKLVTYCPNVSIETIFMSMEYSQQNEPHKLALNLLQRLDFRSSCKHFALQNLPIYYTVKNIKQQYKNNKLKMIALTWNGEFELPDGFYSVARYSDIQDNIEYIIKTGTIIN